jgi:hypothetical protein
VSERVVVEELSQEDDAKSERGMSAA